MSVYLKRHLAFRFWCSCQREIRLTHGVIQGDLLVTAANNFGEHCDVLEICFFGDNADGVIAAGDLFSRFIVLRIGHGQLECLQTRIQVRDCELRIYFVNHLQTFCFTFAPVKLDVADVLCYNKLTTAPSGA